MMPSPQRPLREDEALILLLLGDLRDLGRLAVTIAGGAARRAVGLIPLPRGEETMMKLADHASAVNASQRAVEGLFDDDQSQLNRLTTLMNRVEDLADRVCGAVPLATSPAGGESPHVGHIGVLRDFHGRRESIATRIGEALSRIEQVL